MREIKKQLRAALVFGAGVFTGILVAQCLIVLHARTGGNFGGEVFAVVAMPLLLGAGVSIGRDTCTGRRRTHIRKTQGKDGGRDAGDG